MQSGKNIHVQQHKTNIINEEWNKTQNDAPFVAFYNMRAVTFVPPDEMADVLIVGLQCFILIPRLNHMGSHRPIDSHSKPYLHREKKYRIWNKNYPACCNPTNYRETRRSSLILVASYDRKAEVLFYTVKKNRDPMGIFTPEVSYKKSWYRSTRRCYIPNINTLGPLV